MRKLSIIIAIFILTGCVLHHRPLPDNYAGDTAMIADSFLRLSEGGANMYFIKSINGKPILNSVITSGDASYGQGLKLRALGETRRVLVKELTLHLVAEVYNSAPIVSIFTAGSNYIVEGSIRFTPKVNEKYIVKGKLTKNYSAVWLEDINGNIVSDTIEKKGSSKIKN